MAKKSNLSSLLLLGGVAIGGYLLYKQFFSGQQQPQQSGGYSTNWLPNDTTPQTPMNADTNTPTVTPTVPPVYNPPVAPTVTPVIPNINPTITITPNQDIIVTPIQTPIQKQQIMYEIPKPSGGVSTITIPVPLGVTSATLSKDTSQAWTGATYLQAGQPSVPFLANTLRAATSPTAPTTTKLAATAIAAGAPPRVVAKIKAGSWY